MSDLEVEGSEELEHVFQLILSKAMEAPQHGAACTDMMCGLKERYPTIQDAQGETEAVGVRSARLLLNVVQVRLGGWRELMRYT